MREETLNPMQEAIAFGRVIPGAAAEFTNEPRAEEFYSDAFSAEGNENSALREAAKPNAERQSEAVKKGTNGGGSGGGFGTDVGGIACSICFRSAVQPYFCRCNGGFSFGADAPDTQ